MDGRDRLNERQRQRETQGNRYRQHNLVMLMMMEFYVYILDTYFLGGGMVSFGKCIKKSLEKKVGFK